MRPLLYFILPAMLAVTIGCEEDEPDYPVEPFIKFTELTFSDTPEPSEYDSLILTFNFQDGDHDLGLSIQDKVFPYHPFNFFLAKDGKLEPLNHTEIMLPYDYYQQQRIIVIDVNNDQTGILATVKTRDVDGYAFMPENKFPYTCLNYTYIANQSLDDLSGYYIYEKDFRILDPSYQVTPMNINNTSLYRVDETFYYERNPNQHNIFIGFLIEQPDGSFQEFDFRKEFCTTFDGRFPVVSTLPKGLSVSGPFDLRKKSKWEGSITYSMASVGFIPLFRGKRLKLRVSIKDRALHDSNVIETNVIQF